MSRLRTRVVRAVLLAVVGALALTGCDFSIYSIPLPGGADLGDNPYTVKVEFRDVLDLVPQSSVKVDDVTVGKVEDIQVRGSHAEVTLQLRRSVKLPDNAEAKIRQTSLLGEKFVSLAPPPTGATGRLSNGDVIPLSRSGRNPEVEEVLGALSLLLNGGGVAQLKTISSELNKALGGRESDVRSVLSQLKVFMGRLDTNKDQIVAAIRSLNHLAVSLNRQKSSITLALDKLPRAVASINRQRDDLVKMLRALADLSSVGTRVINQSKTATVDSLRTLAPTLTKLAEAGDSLPKALQVFLTYPFVDAVVGTNPAEARNLHMGDYTDLSIKFDLDLSDLGIGQLCTILPQIKQLPGNLCNNSALQQCVTNLLKTDPNSLNGGTVSDLLKTLVNQCGQGAKNALCSAAGGAGPLGPILNGLCPAAGGSGGLPNPPNLGLKVPSLSKLAKCLRSGDNPLATSGPCSLLSKKAQQKLAYQCTHKKAKYYGSVTCRTYRRKGLGLSANGSLIKLPVGGSGGGNGGGGGLLGGSGGGGGGGGVPGLGRAGFGPAASRASRTGLHPDRVGDLGAMLVWGMVQR